MTWKIIIEIIAGLIVLVLGNIFWSSLKSPNYLRKVMADYEALTKYIKFISKDKLIQAADEVQPIDTQKLTYEDIIRYRLLASFKALYKTRIIFLIIIVLTLIGSYFLIWYFILINLGLFIIMSFNKISSSAENEVFNDVQVVILNLYRWHKIEPEKCKEFCMEKRPTFKIIYTAVVNELIK